MTQQLVKKHDVVVIDKQQKVCEQVYSQYGAISIHGNATRISTLYDAEAEKAEVAIAVMNQDTDITDMMIEKFILDIEQPEVRTVYSYK